ncbi:MAG: DUF2007 domain-containing protein [Gemmatimonadota bacterium]
MEYVEVLRTGNQAELALVESLLQASGIRYHLLDSVPKVFGECGQARVLVEPDRVREAADVLATVL